MASHRIVILVKSFFLRCAVKKVALSHWFVRKARGLGKWFAHWFASLIGCAAFYVVLRIVPDADIPHMVDKINELHLACAGLIGTIFALVLSLSIIPAQRAADAFSPAILTLYRDDMTIKLVSSYLAATAVVSALLGLGWTSGLSPRYTAGFQLLILGTALDAVRWLYRRILDLFNPWVAAGLLRRKIARDIKILNRHVERMANLVRMTQTGSVPAAELNNIRAMIYQRTTGTALRHISLSLDHLLELGVRAIKRQDSYGGAPRSMRWRKWQLFTWTLGVRAST
jgi:hypothetical protein